MPVGKPEILNVIICVRYLIGYLAIECFYLRHIGTALFLDLVDVCG
jgi:hypothetical protein